MGDSQFADCHQYYYASAPSCYQNIQPQSARSYRVVSAPTLKTTTTKYQRVRSWNSFDRDTKYKKRVTKYKRYAVEGKIRSGFIWFRNKIGRN